MFKLLSSIFGQTSRQQTTYPETLVKAAIERAVDGTDPRMRILPGYNKQLREPVIHAIDHVMALVDKLPMPVMATQEGRDTCPALAAVFTSAARMAEILGADSTLREHLTTHAPVIEPVTALLVTQRSEKTGFGYALVDDKVVNDVQQVNVSFDEHRLLDPNANEEECRRFLKRRAFDYLLSIALSLVSEQQDERDKLTQQRALLRCKLDILQKGGSGFSRDMGPQDRAAMQTRLEEIENQLTALGPVHEVLQSNLAIVAKALSEAEKHLWMEEKNLRLDQNYLLHNDTDTGTPAIPFCDLCDSSGRRVTLMMLSIA